MLYKYSGAGNDFVVVYEEFEHQRDNYRQAATIKALCNRDNGFLAADGRIGADGLMILSHSKDYDFEMEFYNPDGSGGMMCGNGGRCIVAFANHIGIKPSHKFYTFKAADGIHTGEILEDNTVKIKMIDPFGFREVLDGYFINTGTRHFVKFVPNIEAIDISKEGPKYRFDSVFEPEGANVNFVQICDNYLKIRTFEKGVEDETLACGTGVTAAAIVAYLAQVVDPRLLSHDVPCNDSESIPSYNYIIETRIAILSVDFQFDKTIKEVYLTGPAELIQ